MGEGSKGGETQAFDMGLMGLRSKMIYDRSMINVTWSRAWAMGAVGQ